MGLIENIKIIRKNKKISNNQIQSHRKVCCESCKYCILSDIVMGYSVYSCMLKNPDFSCCEGEIYKRKCNNYKPCRKYKKYLIENKIDCL